MRLLKTGLLMFIGLNIMCITSEAFTSLNDCLVMQDIGMYKFDPKVARMGNAPGVVGLASHFQDHADQICSGDYSNIDEVRNLPDEEAYAKIFTIDIQVTQHTGGDSDKWLLHEAEKAFRDSDKLEAIPDEDSMIREIEGNKIYFYGGGVVGYRWLNGNVIINIQYNNLSGPKAEPLEVVKAYLAKFPSSIVMSDSDFKSKAHDDQWIKEEMERRLWLCDKWVEQLGLGKAEQKTALQESVKSMNVFLDYRAKYYGLKADDEKILLSGYLEASNEVGIKTKLQEYKDWWAANKSGSFLGVLSVYTHKAYNQISLFFRKIFMFFGSLIKMVFG